jgi:hypothetical protein
LLPAIALRSGNTVLFLAIAASTSGLVMIGFVFIGR